MSIQSEDLQAILEIEAESRKLAAEAKVLGPKAFLQHFSRNSFQGPSAEVNKTFLANTIRQTEVHNRREEVESCWRQHKLQRDSWDESQRDSKRPKLNDHYAHERNAWAKRKLEALASTGVDEREDLSSSSDSNSISSSSFRKKKSKKEKRKKEKKTRKEKKRKKDKKSKAMDLES